MRFKLGASPSDAASRGLTLPVDNGTAIVISFPLRRACQPEPGPEPHARLEWTS